MKDKFTIQIGERELKITDENGVAITLTPSEALLLLDILEEEKSALRRMADEASPLPLEITFKR